MCGRIDDHIKARSIGKPHVRRATDLNPVSRCVLDCRPLEGNGRGSDRCTVRRRDRLAGWTWRRDGVAFAPSVRDRDFAWSRRVITVFDVVRADVQPWQGMRRRHQVRFDPQRLEGFDAGSELHEVGILGRGSFVLQGLVDIYVAFDLLRRLAIPYLVPNVAFQGDRHRSYGRAAFRVKSRLNPAATDRIGRLHPVDDFVGRGSVEHPR